MNCEWIFTCSGLSPLTIAATSREGVCICVGAQTSQPSARTCAVQFIGSIGACDWNGASYTASIFCPAEASVAAASPCFRADFPAGWASNSENLRLMAAVFWFAFEPSSHLTSKTLRPCIADQVLSAITATPFEICTTSLTPGTAFAFEASKLATLPPKTGQRVNTA